MLCKNCKHKHYDYAEDTIECDLAEYEFSEDYKRKDDEGCIYNERTIQKRLREYQEEEMEMLRAICEDIAREHFEKGDNEDEKV